MGIVMTFVHAKDAYFRPLFEAAEAKGILLAASNKLDAEALARRVRSGSVHKAFRGLFARKGYWDTLSQTQRGQHIIRTLSMLHPSWVFSHSSAALMYGLDVNTRIMVPLHYLIIGSRGGVSNSRLVRHRVSEPMGQIKNGANITLLEQTVIDCAAYYPFKYALGIVDSALKQGLTDKKKLNNCLANRQNSRGLREARRVISLADSRSDNGGESYVRALIIEAGMPIPELQVPFENPRKPGSFYYADFLFKREDGTLVVLELDGQQKYIDEAMNKGRGMLGVMMQEREREAAITSYGVQIARLSFKQASNPEVLQSTLASYGIYPIQKRRRKA